METKESKIRIISVTFETDDTNLMCRFIDWIDKQPCNGDNTCITLHEDKYISIEKN